MKKSILYPFVLAAAAILSFSCSGNIDDTIKSLELKADKTTIAADGSDKVVFTVVSDSEDVTASSEIICVSDPAITVSNAEFSTDKAGNYVFQAQYGDNLSEKITVKAEQPEKPSKPSTTSQFVRKVLVMDFTGQWCSNCPSGFNYLYSFQQLYFRNNTYIMAMHNQDDFTIPGLQTEIEKAFSVLAFPYAVIDYREGSPLTDDVQGKLKSSIYASLNDYPAHCGVAVSSAFDKESQKATITVKVMPEVSASFRVAVWIVEDDIVAHQKSGSITEENYHHSHVARQLVSINWRGDLLPDAKEGQEIVKTYEVVANPQWNLDNTEVYAVILDDAENESNVFVNNVEICKFVDGNTDYSYIKK